MIVQSHDSGACRSEAIYSECEAYRYSLTRTWQPQAPRIVFLMLNPSTADAFRNDPTVERCERRARAQGFGAFRVVNLFAWRATDPAALKRAAAPVGPENEAAISEAAGWGHLLLAAWGVHGAHEGRGPAVAASLRARGVTLHHLGCTKDGHPRHPLYVPYAVAPQPWQAPLNAS
jgi:hypothetical protein